MPGRVFVTGASGFVGTAVLEELSSRNFPVNALVNNRPLQAAAGVDSVKGSIFDPDSLARGMAGCQAVIHLVGIIMENPAKGITFERIHHQGTKNVVDATRKAGIKRYIHMSALGTRADGVSEYHKTKYAAEQYIQSTDLEWTIIRPSMIHGPRGELMQMEARWARGSAPPFLFMPYFGAGLMGHGGAGNLQPVFVNDVARAFVDAIENRKTVREIYLLGGSQQLSWPQMHQTVSQAVVGKKRWTMALPVWKAKLLAATVPNRLLGFNRDQIIMSQENNTCDLTKFTKDFGWEPQGFENSLQTYASQLR